MVSKNFSLGWSVSGSKLERRVEPMTRRYYSSRTKPGSLTLEGLYRKLQNLYLLFRDKDFFKEKAGIRLTMFPEAIKHEAGVVLDFQPFPIDRWLREEITEDHIFDMIEFLYDRISKPGPMVDMRTDTGFWYSDYDSYDEEAARKSFGPKQMHFSSITRPDLS
jgi:hypothetical protein